MAGTRTGASKQTDETMSAICDALRAGVPFSRAAKSAGISERRAHQWRGLGWEQIDAADADDAAPLSFVAKFAIAVESALVSYMEPLVASIHSAAVGKGKGLDWRAAKELLASRFPAEFSEKYAASANQKLEVSGEVGHTHSYHLSVDKMSMDELHDEALRLEAQISITAWSAMSDEHKSAWIGHFEEMVVKMRDDRDGITPWHGQVDWHLRPGIPKQLANMPEHQRRYGGARFSKTIEHQEISSAAFPLEGLAPIEAGGDVLVQHSSPAAPSPRPRVQIGIGFDRDSGQAIPIFGDDDDEDLSL